MHHVSINTVRSEALFLSAVQASEYPTVAQIRLAVAAAVRAFGSRECAARVAQEFGEHPELAVERMRWARRMIDEVFAATRPQAEHVRFASAATAHAA